ncbi:hypothetical protein CAOG_03861 [Capsaspora owczarzaki ATCC 30864]|uniref:U6 snRNA phosphodiesterase 1 n=1 Tax=Capsaspora owczarzaki (strain ATCC 30864) TaxID=595528 RepID=A0A0D2WNZ3_CAPO3|nr:hypothetical protein CAOG_03861 [Capsaspora owczarzaki ATCC 30864]KJE92995.1 hypothetical protein CAOG_003861 [Capsaspora owczarzaki ATCC 30864]|eukprot:XP_004363589.1 hypothetical protein CAOG_03861 [Capsaspora owczarzaki ATCC 30864]
MSGRSSAASAAATAATTTGDGRVRTLPLTRGVFATHAYAPWFAGAHQRKYRRQQLQHREQQAQRRLAQQRPEQRPEQRGGMVAMATDASNPSKEDDQEDDEDEDDEDDEDDQEDQAGGASPMQHDDQDEEELGRNELLEGVDALVRLLKARLDEAICREVPLPAVIAFDAEDDDGADPTAVDMQASASALPAARQRNVAEHGWVAIDPADMHISVTRPLVVSHAKLSPLLDRMRARLRHQHGGIVVDLADVEFFVNDERTRTFVSLMVRRGLTGLKPLVKQVDAVLRDFPLQEFYDEPRFHLSVAWCVGDCMPLLQRLITGWPASLVQRPSAALSSLATYASDDDEGESAASQQPVLSFDELNSIVRAVPMGCSHDARGSTPSEEPHRRCPARRLYGREKGVTVNATLSQQISVSGLPHHIK